jgi:hypothetical protein
MNKNIKGIIAVLVIGGLGYFAYKKLGKPKSVDVVSNYLDSIFGGDSKEKVSKFDKGYVDNWSEAIMNGSQTFEYNGKTYITKGGKQKIK